MEKFESRFLRNDNFLNIFLIPKWMTFILIPIATASFFGYGSASLRRNQKDIVLRQAQHKFQAKIAPKK